MFVWTQISQNTQYGTGARRLVARLNSFVMCGSTKIKNFAGVTQCTVPVCNVVQSPIIANGEGR